MAMLLNPCTLPRRTERIEALLRIGGEFPGQLTSAELATEGCGLACPQRRKIGDPGGLRLRFEWRKSPARRRKRWCSM